MKASLLPVVLICLLLHSCDKVQLNSYTSDWNKSPDGTWTGPDYWANRLQDWEVSEGRLECTGTLPMRTLHLMSRRISERRGTINSSVKIFHAGGEPGDYASSAGILIGAGNGLDQRAASLVFHSWGEKAGIYAGLDGRGNLFIRDFEKENTYFARNTGKNNPWKEAHLILTVFPHKEGARIRILAINPFTNNIIDRIEVTGIASGRLTGNLALVSHAGYGSEKTARYSFADWKVSGSRTARIGQGNTGPLAGAQYTLSRNTLKLTVQLMPVAGSDIGPVTMQIREDDEWKDAATAEIDSFSFTARFRIENWNRTNDIEYRIGKNIRRIKNRHYYINGIIRHDPADRNEIRMLSLSCIEQIIMPDGGEYRSIDGGMFNYGLSLLYPHASLIENLKRFNADILCFTGDQVYEGSSPTRPDLEKPFLDYLYKWYLWCYTYRDLTTNIPAITIPDDHDVYHGNLWGDGGRAVPEGLTGAEAQDAGGYKMPPAFVNMVQQTQTSHLPDPADPVPAGQGINVYFTECNIGGISIAILEDRKFKSAPKALFPEADIYNGWPRNRYWNARYSARTDRASLLGSRQLDFLDKWSSDWSNGSWMKVALSQTLFANLATIPADSLTDDVVPYMQIPDSGSYIRGEKLATDFDSNGWPQDERDKALRIIRKAFAIHVAGDQHLGSTLQYGIDDHRDAGFAIVSPATGNNWPRHWFPPSAGYNRKEGWPENLGDFFDGFGNRITVLAVANPHKSTIEPVRHNQHATGYSAITFHRDTRKIEMANWPYYAGPENGKPFPFWPVTINQTDNYGRQPAGWLPEIRIEGMSNPVIRVIREFTGEMIYSLRINGNAFQPWIFEYGYYIIEAGEPDLDKWQKSERVYPTAFREREPLNIKF